MTLRPDRRQFLHTAAVTGASLVLPRFLFAADKKSVLVFTKSSGFEHDVVKTVAGKPSIVEQTVTNLGTKYGFDVMATKDGRVFESGDFRKHAAVLFFTTGDLTAAGTDKNPPMSPQEKALEFMLFDATSCILPDNVTPTAPRAIQPPPAAPPPPPPIIE